MRSLFYYVLFVFSICFSTEQQKEKFIHQGVTRSIEQLPIESLWGKFKPSWIEGVVSNNWKGYRATWKLQNDSLFLVSASLDAKIFKDSIVLGGIKNERIPQEIFIQRKLPIFAFWYTGHISFPVGDRFFDGGSGSLSPEREMLFIFKEGKLVSKFSKSNKRKYSDDSNENITYVMLGKNRIEGEFFDLRRIFFGKNVEGKRSRGILNLGKYPSIFIPNSPSMDLLICRIVDSKIPAEFKENNHIEFYVEKVIGKANDCRLKISDIRRLQYGESIHKHSFEILSDQKRIIKK